MTVTVLGGKRQLRLVFGYQSTADYQEVLVTAGRKWRARGRVRGKRVIGHGANRSVLLGQSFRLRLHAVNGRYLVYVDGKELFDAKTGGSGRVGITAVNTPVAIDDVRISPAQ